MSDSKDNSLLYSLSLPRDLKNLSHDELDTLAAEIRQKLLEIGEKCGGHLASNLGVVELTIALHAVFESPKDRFVWDTSHQTYTHKMLTGRLEQIFSIRQEGGLAGFANIFESEHDQFGAGHASTALSAALGMAQARELKGETNAVIAILGDASLSGGMAFEALNNIEKLKGNFICILNDNDMSISRPVGSMADYFTKIRTSSSYTAAKQRFEKVVEKIPKFGVPLRRRIEKLVDHLRDVVLDIKVGVLFEEFGFKYLGPIDGHNIGMVMAALKFAKTHPGPVMIHMLTKKGKGHLPAETDPILYHGVSPKKATQTGSDAPVLPSYPKVFGKALVALASTHPDMVVVTPAMKEGSGLNEFEEKFPDRFFDVGIAEEHAVTFCAGLSRAGVRPVLSIYSTFLQRGYDQLIHDVCLQKLPVVFCLDRAGLVGEDGPTHHGVFDIAFLLPIPNLIILAPRDGEELTQMLSWSLQQSLPVSIRYPRGQVPASRVLSNRTIPVNQPELLAEAQGSDTLLIGFGSTVSVCEEAAVVLTQQGVPVSVLNLRCVKPLDTAVLRPLFEKMNRIIVVEDGVKIGGVCTYLSTEFADLSLKWESVAVPDTFIEHGPMSSLRAKVGLAPAPIVERVLRRNTVHV